MSQFTHHYSLSASAAQSDCNFEKKLLSITFNHHQKRRPVCQLSFCQSGDYVNVDLSLHKRKRLRIVFDEISSFFDGSVDEIDVQIYAQKLTLKSYEEHGAHTVSVLIDPHISYKETTSVASLSWRFPSLGDKAEFGRRAVLLLSEFYTYVDNIFESVRAKEYRPLSLSDLAYVMHIEELKHRLLDSTPTRTTPEEPLSSDSSLSERLSYSSNLSYRQTRYKAPARLLN